MDPNTLIGLYMMGFRISLGILIAAMAAAAFIFFRFDVPGSYAILTAKAGKKGVKEAAAGVRDGNKRTGRKSYSPASGEKSEAIPEHTGHTGCFRLRFPKTAAGMSAGRSGPGTSVSMMAGAPKGAGHVKSGGEKTAVIAATTDTKRNFRFSITEDTVIIHTDEIIQ